MKRTLFFRFGLLAILTFCMGCLDVSAHPMPNSVVLLQVHAARINAELQIPLVELQSSWGHAVNDSSAGLVRRLGPQLKSYLKEHIRLQSPDGSFWIISIGDMKVSQTQNPLVGVYRELTVQLTMAPPAGQDVRSFTLYYDAVLHQVVTHQILVAVSQDWERGRLTVQEPAQVGTISTDIVSGRVPALSVNLASGSRWTGFVSMIKLGTEHIAQGTDHLLFLLVLLLPAPLLWTKRRWGKSGGLRYSLLRLLTMVTSFTIGHSVTLLIASLGWIHLPSQPIEILIAISILITAMHAIRPLFAGRETWVAAGFGLIHGLAFATTLVNLQLETGPMVLSILGFNIGIELMQLAVIGLTIPWLILLSRTPVYRFVRIGGALLAAAASAAWIMERLSERPNLITHLMEAERKKAVWLLAAIAVFALYSSWRFGKGKQTVLNADQ